MSSKEIISKMDAPPKNEIIGDIKLRYKNGQQMLYWCESHPNGKLSQSQLYWGKLPVRKLNLLLNLINNNPPRARYRICKIIGLKIDDFPESNLRNSNFLKRDILGELKKREKSKIKPDKRFLSGEKRRATHQVRQRHYWIEFTNQVDKLRIIYDEFEKEEKPKPYWNSNSFDLFLSDYLEQLEEIIRRARKWQIEIK